MERTRNKGGSESPDIDRDGKRMAAHRKQEVHTHDCPGRPDYSVQPLDETMSLCDGLREKVPVGSDTRVRVLEDLLQRPHQHTQRVGWGAEGLGMRRRKKRVFCFLAPFADLSPALSLIHRSSLLIIKHVSFTHPSPFLPSSPHPLPPLTPPSTLKIDIPQINK